MICPQLKGQSHDSTHITYFDRDSLTKLCAEADLEPVHKRSFPFPQIAGRWLYFNETIVVARRRTQGDSK
jgi:hypothetical protein